MRIFTCPFCNKKHNGLIRTERVERGVKLNLALMNNYVGFTIDEKFKDHRFRDVEFLHFECAECHGILRKGDGYPIYKFEDLMPFFEEEPREDI